MDIKYKGKGKISKDQYGDNIPEDLVPLQSFEGIDFDKNDLKIIIDANWYDCNGQVWVSYKECKGLIDDDDESPLEGMFILRIAQSLKRWNTIDGFYHA